MTCPVFIYQVYDDLYRVYLTYQGISHLSSAWPQLVLRKYIKCADDSGPGDIRVGPRPGSHFMAPKKIRAH